MFEVKTHTRQEFYHVYKSWCENHNFPPIPMVWCPETVFVAYNGETPTHSCFFWHTDSALALIGFPASNKLANSELKVGGLEFLYGKICEFAKENHYVSVCTYVHLERPTISDALKENNFILGDEGMANFIKNLV